MTRSGITGLICTTTELHFCLYMKVALIHHEKHQVLDHRWPGLLSQTAFCQCFRTTRMHFSALRGINRTAWGTKLLLMAVLAYSVDCISLCHILKVQYSHLSLNGYRLLLPTHPPQLSPTHPPSIESIRDITGTEKTI